jgi:hypothetical protein
MKEEVRQSAAREADLPAIFHKPWQAENPPFGSAEPGRCLAAAVAPPSALTMNCEAPFSTLTNFLTNFTVHLRAHLCTIA